MKKTLIALAAVAATSAAFAQSSVTIDGVIDLGVVNPIGAAGTRIDVTNGGNQIRFRGSEDLGGGLRANFILAQRFSPESGGNDGTANNRPTFQGESTVGLSGGFGAVKIGRSLTAFGGRVNLTDPWGTLQQGSIAILSSGYSADPDQADSAGLGRTDAIHYSTPSFGGFSAAVSYGFKESTASGALVNNTDAFTSVWLSYAAGPLYIGGGAESNRKNDDATAILGTYDFGMFKLGGGYGNVESAAGVEIKNWNIMGIVPLGAVTLKVGYGKSKNDTTDTDRSKKFGIGLDYPLSKRTLIYTSYGRDSVPANNNSGFDVGIRHTF